MSVYLDALYLGRYQVKKFSPGAEEAGSRRLEISRRGENITFRFISNFHLVLSSQSQSDADQFIYKFI